MKTAFFIEDSPAGLVTKFVWQANGCVDHPADSVAMHLQANFINMVREMDEKGLLRVVKEGPGDNPKATAVV
jgi:hypothetical protein